MKRVVVLLLALVLFVSMAGAVFAATGKVAIVTNTVSQNEEEYRSAEQMVAKYGDRIVHVTWPDNFMAEQEQMVSIVARLAADPDVNCWSRETIYSSSTAPRRRTPRTWQSARASS